MRRIGLPRALSRGSQCVSGIPASRGPLSTAPGDGAGGLSANGATSGRSPTNVVVQPSMRRSRRVPTRAVGRSMVPAAWDWAPRCASPAGCESGPVWPSGGAMWWGPWLWRWSSRRWTVTGAVSQGSRGRAAADHPGRWGRPHLDVASVDAAGRRGGPCSQARLCLPVVLPGFWGTAHTGLPHLDPPGPWWAGRLARLGWLGGYQFPPLARG